MITSEEREALLDFDWDEQDFWNEEVTKMELLIGIVGILSFVVGLTVGVIL